MNKFFSSRRRFRCFLTDRRDSRSQEKGLIQKMAIDSTALAGAGETIGRTAVRSAIQRAGDATGVNFDFLLRVAQRESSLDPTATARTSSAAGLFQFIEQTWFAALKTHGAKHGLGEYAQDISRASTGRYTVADAARRDEILSLRFDPRASAALAGELTNDNKRILETRLGRGVSNAELYTAHFLGAGGAVKLLSAPNTAKAADIVPAAAAANKPVFYDGARARTVDEVIQSIARSMGEAPGQAPEQKSTGLLPVAERIRGGQALTPVRPGFVAARTAPEVSETPGDISTASADALSRMRAERLSVSALTVLQALDPTRLGKSRDNDRDSRV